MDEDNIVALGLLTKRDLGILGAAFTRHIPVPDDDRFADLLEKLDKLEASPTGYGVVLQFPSKPGTKEQSPEDESL